MTDPTASNAREAAIDATIAKAHEALYRANAEVERSLLGIHRTAGDQQVKRLGWMMTDADAVARVRPMAEGRNNAAHYITAYDAACESAEAAQVAYDEAEKLYEGWSRFFLVQNANGHIHRYMRCSTCHRTTQFAWLTDLSGLTETEAVAAHGTRLCSTCYPSAPVEWTVGIATPQADRCAGSGAAPAEGSVSGNRRYARCSVCDKHGALSKYGAVRAHKPA